MANKQKKHNDDDSMARKGKVTGGKWMGRVIEAAQKLSYNVGMGVGAASAGGKMLISDLMNAIKELATDHVSDAHKIGASIAGNAGAHVEKLAGLGQKPYASNDSPSIGGQLANAFKAGARDGEKKMRSLKRSKNNAKTQFSSA